MNRNKVKMNVDKLEEFNYQLNEGNLPKFEYVSLCNYFKESRFYLIDNENYQLEQIQIQNKIPLVLFYFLEDSEGVDMYLILYSNQVGIIYDLILGTDKLSEIFFKLFQNHVIVPIKNEDKITLSHLIDLSNNFFLNAYFISQLYQHESLKTIINKFSINFCKENNIDMNNIYIINMIKSIMYYYPLIPIITDNYQLSPVNYGSKTLPIFKIGEFIKLSDFYFLYKKKFEIYYFKSIYDSFYTDTIEFFSKIYKRNNNSYIIPCYGIIHNKEKKQLLMKFICNKTIDFDECLTDSERSSLIYSLLASITSLQECGYYTRALDEKYFLKDHENKIYYASFEGICKLNNTYNGTIGILKYMTQNQYSKDICLPSCQVYSLVKMINYFLAKKYYEGNSYIPVWQCFYVDDEKMNFIFRECLNVKEEEIPDSLILFIQMYELNLFFRKTNRKVVEQIFREFFEFYMNSEITGGKYMTEWSKMIKDNQFKNLIINNFPLTFIIQYSKSKLAINLKKYQCGKMFDDIYEKHNLFKINFLCKILKQETMKKETDEIIDKLPPGYQILSRMLLYSEMIEKSNAEETELMYKYLNNEINYFISNYEYCISYAYLFSISPLFIFKTLDENEVYLDDSHQTIEYLIKINEKERLSTRKEDSIVLCIEILKHFRKHSYEDIKKMNYIFDTDIFDELISKENETSAFTIEIYEKINSNQIDKINSELQNIIKNIDNIKKQLDSNKEVNFQKLEMNQKSMIQILEDIAKQQHQILYLTKQGR